MGALLSELLGEATKNHIEERALIDLGREVEAFDGRRILITSPYMADKIAVDLSAILKEKNLKITRRPEDMQLEKETEA